MNKRKREDENVFEGKNQTSIESLETKKLKIHEQQITDRTRVFEEFKKSINDKTLFESLSRHLQTDPSIILLFILKNPENLNFFMFQDQLSVNKDFSVLKEDFEKGKFGNLNSLEEIYLNALKLIETSSLTDTAKKEFKRHAIPFFVKNVEEFRLKALEIDPFILFHIDIGRYSSFSKNVFKKAMKLDMKNLVFVTSKFLQNKEFYNDILLFYNKAIKGPFNYIKLVSLYSDDEEVFSFVISNYRDFTNYPTKNKTGNSSSIKEPSFMEYASKRLKNEREFVLKVVEWDPNSIKYISEELKNDKEIILKGVNKKGICFKFASKELKNDKKTVLKAIHLNDEILKYVSDELKNDKEVVIASIKKNQSTISYVSNDLLGDEEFVKSLLGECKVSIHRCSEELKNNKEIMALAIQKNPYNLEHVSKELRDDEEFVFEAIKLDPSTYRFATPRLRNDFNFSLTALKLKSSMAFELMNHTSMHLRNNKDFITEAVKLSPYCFDYASEPLKYDREFITEMTAINVEILRYVSFHISKNLSFGSKFTQSEKGQWLISLMKISLRAVQFFPDITGLQYWCLGFDHNTFRYLTQTRGYDFQRREAMNIASLLSQNIGMNDGLNFQYFDELCYRHDRQSIVRMIKKYLHVNPNVYYQLHFVKKICDKMDNDLFERIVNDQHIICLSKGFFSNFDETFRNQLFECSNWFMFPAFKDFNFYFE